MNQPFRCLLLDLGVVLLHLQYERAVVEAAKHCDPARMGAGLSFLKLLGRSSIVDDYERGDITSQQFFDHFVAQTGFTGSFEAFAGIWRNIFAENTPMIEFGRRMSRHMPVYIFTNASELHVPWVFDRYPSLQFHSGIAASWELKASKPSAAYYERALARFQLNPADCLFIDDRPENIEGARKCNIPSILYTTVGETMMHISGLGRGIPA